MRAGRRRLWRVIVKAHVYFRHGLWWCAHLGCMGCGSSAKDAWDHILMLYREALLHRPMRVIVPTERSPDLL